MTDKTKRFTGYALTGALTMFLLFDVAITLIVTHGWKETGRFPIASTFSIGVMEGISMALYPIRKVMTLGGSLLIGLLFGVHAGLFLWGGLWLRSPDLRSAFPVRRMAA